MDYLEPHRSEKSAKTIYMTNPERFIDLFFSESKPVSPAGPKKKLAVFGVLAATLLAVAILIAWPASPEKKLNSLVEQGKYRECLLLAGKMPNEKGVRSIVMSAFVKEVVRSGWPVKINRGFFTEARTIPENIGKTTENPDVAGAIRALNWVAGIEEHFYNRRPETPVVLLRDEARMESLLNTWDADRKEITGILDRLAGEGADIRQRVYAHADTLHRDKFQYLEAIKDLKTGLGNLTDAEAVSAIDEFRRRYPGVGGIDDLKKTTERKN